MDETLIDLADKAGQILVKKKFTIAIAESVTSGNLQAVFSLAKNAISFYQGGITAYNIGQKCKHLSVEPTHAIDCNCVSGKVSNEMAIAVAQMFCSDIGLSSTGYASPVPEQNIGKLFAHISISKKGKIILSKKIIAPNKPPYEVQIFYSKKLIELLISVLK